MGDVGLDVKVAKQVDGVIAEVEGAVEVDGGSRHPERVENFVYRLANAFRDSEEIRGRILHFVQCHAGITGQIAGCNRIHNAEQRLARWLLMAWDRTQELALNFTQEYLSEMIAVERTTVSAIAADMQRKGLIERCPQRVGQRLRLLSKCLANSRRNRNDEYDPQGPRRMGSKGGCCCGSTVHR